MTLVALAEEEKLHVEAVPTTPRITPAAWRPHAIPADGLAESVGIFSASSWWWCQHVCCCIRAIVQHFVFRQLAARTTMSRLLVVVATVAAVANAATCQNLLPALQPLRSSANYSTCQVDASAAAICTSTACASLMAPLAALDLPTCQLSLKGISFNTASLKLLRANSCAQPQQRVDKVSAPNMLLTILRLLKDT
ncbi:unnamed protein product [Phytophthora lilii]|uniref:Elicitin n=1 Tax=Phytophthora lilii TaxID=2077276 RepID=A0A9W6TSU5_9STRA|nr:unnamed protein product [Phytophthora lilii]